MKPLLVTSGEPAGIGPDICLTLSKMTIPLVVMGDIDVLRQRAKQLGVDVELYNYDATSFEGYSNPNALAVYHICAAEQVVAGVLCSNNAPYVIEMLERAVALCLQGDFSAIVTAPVHKAVINDYGINFSGHTEFLAQHCGVDKVVMMLASDILKVALVTTHIPLAKVSKSITTENLSRSIRILYHSLQKDFQIPNPNIFIAGLNPHAGENGYLGQEEQQIMIPLISNLKKEGLALHGPMAADTMFSAANNAKCDAYLAMYHDQGLSVIKYASFGHAVNVTLGLPIIRTSVDHGTALALAGSTKASNESILYAINTAWKMAQGQQ